MKCISWKFLLPVFFLVLFFWGGCSSPQEREVSAWPEVTREMKPWTRWWWMGSAVNEQELKWHLETFADKGFGGVEIAPIYGAKGYEEEYVPFLSPRWMEVLQYLIAKSDSLDMGVDMTNGTGWPFGGPHIGADVAAAQLLIQDYMMTPASETLVLEVADERQRALEVVDLIAVTAYGPNGEIKDLSDLVEGNTLNWQPDEGEWQVLAAFNGRTRQQVKRAAPGGEGYTFDHFSKEALAQYLSRFDEVFGEEAPGVRAFFNDSYELFGASWGAGFENEFEQRRGYSLKPYLRELAGGGDEEVRSRIKADYRETMSELLIERFSTGWTAWTNSKGAVSRNQSHGSPANLLDVYATVDIPEIETFGGTYFPIKGFFWDEDYVKQADHNELFLKMAASAANISGKKLVSSESFTWLGEHFRVPLSQAKPEAEQLFLSGVNHIFYHGSTFSPKDAPWPGWLFYASVHFAPSNSFWEHIEGLNTYITRCQSILQGGTAANDVLVYWPIYDTWHNPDGLDKMMSVHGSREWLNSEQMKQLQAKGYSFDFVSDALLKTLQPDAGGLVTADGVNAYDAVVVPECTRMPLETMELLIALSEQGVPVIFQSFPTDVPGLQGLDERLERLETIRKGFSISALSKDVSQWQAGDARLMVAEQIEAALKLTGVQRETLTDLGLKYIKRHSDQGIYYYLVNHSAEDVDAEVVLNEQAAGKLLLDPQNGAYGRIVGRAVDGGTALRIQLRSGEAKFILFTDRNLENMPAWAYLTDAAQELELTENWKVEFVAGGPELPAAQQQEVLQPWTEDQDGAAAFFSGTAVYSTSFDLDEAPQGNWRLDLGEVLHSARVKLNGQDLGVLWSPPYTVELGDFLKEGRNELEVEVANLMANRIRFMDQNQIEWQLFHEINFVDISYRGFNAAEWPVMPSGLKGPVRLIQQMEAPAVEEMLDAGEPLVFRFGASVKEDGLFGVLPHYTYSSRRVYGLDLESRVESIESEENEFVALGADAPFYFSVAVPEGHYRVTVVAGHPDKDSELTIKAESRRWMAGPEHIPAGETRSFSFLVNRRSPYFAKGDSIRRKSREYGYLNWDEKLTLEFSGQNPSIHSVQVEAAPKETTTVFLVGNSTVVDQETEPYASWGQMITRFFGEQVAVANYAESGESLASSKSSGRFAKVLHELKKGDYVLIEFGHNDQKRKGEGIGPYTSFTALMTELVNKVKDKGGVPIVVTPIQRRRFDEAGRQLDTHGDYPDAVRKVARREQVHLIDLTRLSTTLFEALGPIESKNAFVHYPAGSFPGQTKALEDNTHFNNYGAYLIAMAVVKGLQESASRLDRFLIRDLPSFNIEAPMPFSSWKLPHSVRADVRKPDGN